jgi:hypothetical protein
MSSISDFKEWLKEICYDNSKYIKVDERRLDSPPVSYFETYKVYIKVYIYTDSYRYSIVAIERENPLKSYLSCMVSNRKSRTGEDWIRSKYLSHGKLKIETWEKIKNAIIKNELVPLEINNKYTFIETSPVKICSCGEGDSCSNCKQTVKG